MGKLETELLTLKFIKFSKRTQTDMHETSIIEFSAKLKLRS